MTTLWTILSILVNYVLVAVATIHILRHPREPRAMWAWILWIAIVPVIGLITFVAIGTPRIERTRRRRHRRRQQLVISLSRRASNIAALSAAQLLDKLDASTRHLMRLATRVSSYPPTHSNAVTIFDDEQSSFEELKRLIREARSHVHMEYYIFRPDEAGMEMCEVLKAKAREGVEVRLLLDYIGSWSARRSSFTRPLREAGVEVAFFLPVVPWQGPGRINLRNHRKILVVDGEIAFTGSHNIANEYLGRHPTLGLWQDTNLTIRGPAVRQLQEVFIEDWLDSTGRELTSDKYFPPAMPVGQHIAQVIPSGPDTGVNAILDVMFSAITAAQRSIRVMTPYFVPDAAVLQALQSAAQSGVQVELVVPSQNDMRLVLWAGRSYYAELVRAGVEVYEYDAGMLHNKVMIVDDFWSMVGSANMDHRSFRLNFELSIVLYDSGLAQELLEDYNSLKQNSRRIAPDGHLNWTFGESLLLGGARLFSPLL